LCSKAATEKGTLHNYLLFAPSWRTVVGIPHDDHVARERVPSAYGPEVEGIVQVDVGKQR
jgi:hypothetical protein